MKLIGLIGKKQSGKSTAAKYLNEKYKFAELSFATRLKEGAMALFDLTEEQVNGPSEIREAIIPHYEMSARQILQWLGTDVLREKWPNFHVDVLRRQINHHNFYDKWVITDVRFPNEIEFIKELGGITLRVVRKSQEDEVNKDTHISENALNDIKTDFTIECEDGVKHVYKHVDKFMNLMQMLRKDWH